MRHGAVARASTEAARPPGASEGRRRRSAYTSALLRAPHPDLDLNRLCCNNCLSLVSRHCHLPKEEILLQHRHNLPHPSMTALNTHLSGLCSVIPSSLFGHRGWLTDSNKLAARIYFTALVFPPHKRDAIISLVIYLARNLFLQQRLW